MSPNLWLYASKEEQQSAAAALIIFGAEIFKKAKIIRELELLEQVRQELDKQNINNLPPPPKILMEFSFEYLIDSIRMLIFYENYMKAALISHNICVHTINNADNNFKELAKQQFKRPIDLREINEIQAFRVDEKSKHISHPALRETTLSISTLIGSSAYRKYYEFSNNITTFLLHLIKYRNRLHFHNSIEFNLSEQFIMNIRDLNSFVDQTLKKITKHPG